MKRSCGIAIIMLLCSCFLFAGGATEEEGKSEVVVSQGEYSESPILSEMVKEKKLPPLEERLPENPMVQKTPEIGSYGGTMYSFFLGHPDRWAIQNSALTHQWVQTPSSMESIMEKGIANGMDPNVIESWDWSADGKELTLYFRKGVKWSDGYPVTADDLMFAWYDFQMNPDYTPNPIGSWLVDGEAPDLQKIDDYTAKFIFSRAGEPQWYMIEVLQNRRIVMPKHYLKEFHPRYNNEATYKGLLEVEQWWNPERPTTAPWRVVKYDPSEECVLERNPYYWGVDEAGQQLPYIDKVVYKVLANSEAALLQGVSGQLDFACRNFQFLDSYPMLKEGEAKGGYRIVLTSGMNWTIGTEVWFSYDLQDENYPELREMLRNTKFRKALSIAIDRSYFNESLFLGLGTPTSLTLSENSPYWDSELEEIVSRHIEYNPDGARKLLDELGLQDRNNDGIREYPNGKPVVFILDAASEYSSFVKCGELYVKYWRDIGVDAKLNVQARQIILNKSKTSSSHGTVWGTGPQLLLFPRIEGAIMAGNQSPDQYKAGFIPNPPEDLQKLWDLNKEFNSAMTAEKAKEVVKEIARLRVENTMGIFTLRDVPMIVLLNNKIANFPEDFVVVNRALGNADAETWFFKD